ncbi:major facilitator superfamily domain-containing protein [Xylaria bambusicola]|uniref:major facilitator superfamily domain-containing protein n=1 Tax=Xylaria bambusicola TaxID=326684 RepID=UPI0020087E7F|nr:major facilitator superfamily domain-containing protein [Xylaria bambusicola]KAI0506651.1 major facilitator superfamily domain-containing protein [Xylaria bambusicola]
MDSKGLGNPQAQAPQEPGSSDQISVAEPKMGNTFSHNRQGDPNLYEDEVKAAYLNEYDEEEDDEILYWPRSPAAVEPSTPATTSLDQNSQIDYMYLTFDTDLPVPNFPIAKADTVIPESPDLSRYIDPMRWPRSRKTVMVTVACIGTLATAYAAGAYSPPINLIIAELHTTREVGLLGVTTFCLGFAYAPMILAPFSEINGRYPIFAIAGVVFTVFQAACGLVTNVPGMLIARFFTGVGGSVFSTMVGGVISDLYENKDRNAPMAIFSMSVLIGTGLGPLVSSIIVEQSGPDTKVWKWVFWHQVILDFVVGLAVVLLFKESRGSVVLSRKANALNKWYERLEELGIVGVWVADSVSPVFRPGQLPIRHPNDCEKQSGSVHPEGVKLRRIRWTTVGDEARGSLMTMVSTSLTRPFEFLFTEPIVFFFSLWVSFAWAVLYLTFGSIPLVFRRQYNFNTQQSGYVFAALIVGSTIGAVLGIFQDKFLQHPNWRNPLSNRGSSSGSDSDVESIEPSTHGAWVFIRRRFPAESPESRLYLTCFTAVLLPIGLFLFGFSAEPSTHWIVPTIGVGLASAGIYYIYLATFNYLADIYQTYASSAIAAQSFCRNILGGVFPLVTTPLFTNLGEDAAGGLLGAIATLLTVVPWALVLFGERIRRRSKYAIALEKPT